MTGIHELDAPVRIAVVVVTYGARWHLLRCVLTALETERLVSRIVVVDNGAAPAVSESVGREFAASRLLIEVIVMGRNSGSAGGYAAGITRARGYTDCTHLLLLDDDNRPDSGCIEALARLHELARREGDVALSALRKGRAEYERLLDGRTARQILPNSFLGFRVEHLLTKPWTRLLGRARAQHARHLMEISVAPYGGLFFSRQLANHIEPPRADFVLYGDDHEYTARLVESGARLLLTDLAMLEDLDASWSEAGPGENPWIRRGAPAWRAYYAVRNRSLVERRFTDSPRVYRLNRGLYLGLLFLCALRVHRSFGGAQRALAPLREAVADAEANRLGECSEYPIPQPAMATSMPPVVWTAGSMPAEACR
jgi:GT2 family glycosyltransferase